MRQKLFTLAAGVSAVLCLATVALFAPLDKWASRPSSVLWRHATLRSSVEIERAGGRLAWSSVPRDFDAVVHSVPPGRAVVARREWTLLNCRFQELRLHNGETVRWFGIPYQLLVIAWFLLPELWAILWVIRIVGRRRRRMGASLCTSCGYDLRATPDRCPEMFSLL